MGRVTIEEDRFINLIKKEGAYSNIMVEIIKCREEAVVYGDNGKPIERVTTFDISNETLKEHTDVFYKIMEEY